MSLVRSRGFAPFALTAFFLLAACSTDGDVDGPVAADASDVTDAATADVGADVVDVGGTEDVAPADTAPTSDVGDADADVADAEDAAADSGDVLTDPSDGSDSATDAGPSCVLPVPRIGSTGEAVAFAASPDRCGQAEFSWLDAEGMGQVVATHRELEWPSGILSAALIAADITTHRPPAHNVQMKVISYVTQDRGAETTATAAIAWPDGVALDEVPIALILHGTSGFNDSCAPSQAREWQALVAVFASWGYLAVAPDYIGMRSADPASTVPHAYLVGQQVAIGSLDAARAAIRLVADEAPDLCPSNRVLVWGASQGGHAAAWTDLLAPTYAAELDVVGVASAIPPLDVAGQTERALSELVGGSGPVLAFLAIAPAWYGFEDLRSQVFREELIDDIDAILMTPCGEPRPESPVDLDDLTAVFTESLVATAREGELDTLEPWGCLIAENDPVLATVPRVPHGEDYGLLVITGEDDELVYTPLERARWAELCEAGIPTSYLECAGANHVEGGVWSFPEVGRFFDTRAQGDPFFAATVCEANEPQVCSGTPTGD